jgi:Tat protein translocase TatB subunit
VISNFGWGEIAVILVIGLFVFGPERLPKVIADGVRMLRQLRAQATSITSDLRSELDLGEFRDLDPRAGLREHLGLDGEGPRGEAGDGLAGSAAGRARPQRQQRLRTGEVPPYDPDAT